METADSTEQNGSARGEESSDLGISTTRTQGPDICLSGIGQHGEPLCTPFEDQACALTAQTHGPMALRQLVERLTDKHILSDAYHPHVKCPTLNKYFIYPM